MSESMDTGEEQIEGAPPPVQVEVAAAPKKVFVPKAPKPDGALRGGFAEADRDIDSMDAKDLKEYVQNLMGGSSEILVNITRNKPSVGPNGENIAGSCETVSELVDDEYIREMWGGGTFTLKISLPRGKNGSMVFWKSRKLVIAGEPKHRGVDLKKGTPIAALPIGPSDDHVERAIDVTERAAQRAEQRADRLEQEARSSRGLDPQLLQSITAPLTAQISSLTNQLSQAMAVANRPPPTDPFRDRMLESMIGGESQRVETIRATYEARIDKIRDEHESHIKRLQDAQREDIKRLEDRHERELERVREDIKRLEDRHGHDLRMAEKTSGSLTDNSKIAYEARIDAMKAENARMERDLNAATTKIGALEAIKNQSVGDKVDEIMKLREGLDGLGGGSGDEPWYTQIIGALGSSEAVVGLVNKLAGGAPAPDAQQAMAMAQAQQGVQLPPVGVPMRGPDGRTYVNNGKGQMVLFDQAAAKTQRALAAARKQRKAGTAPAAANDEVAGDEAEGDAVADGLADDEAPVVVGRPPTAEEMKLAIPFMENAFKGNAPPQIFGQSVRNFLPGDVVAYLQSVGFEKFLSMAQLSPGSPFTNMRGRLWLRKVVEFLTTGEVKEDPAP